MRVLIFLLLIVFVGASDTNPREKSQATKIWEWFDDNIPPAFRPIWREANEAAREIQENRKTKT